MDDPIDSVTKTRTVPRLDSRQDMQVHQAVYRHVPLRVTHFQFPGDMFPFGCWCFYLFLHEPVCPNFEQLWLPDVVRPSLSGKGRGHVLNDYDVDPFMQIEMHGGITWYEKHGYTPGFRSVEIGCDFQHADDIGRQYTLDEVLKAACRAVDSCYELGLIVEPRKEDE